MRFCRLIFLFSVLVLACKVSKPVNRAYNEDLSVYRLELPKVIDLTPAPKTFKEPVELYGHITKEIDSISHLMVAQNKKLNLRDGFVIQVYSNTNRDEALDIHNYCQDIFPELLINLTYNQPNYRIKIGAFHEKLTATRFLNDIKKTFPKSIVIAEKIPIIGPDE